MARKTYDLVEVDNTGRPVQDSENGKTNSYSHHCDEVMHSKSYAACLNLIKKREDGRLQVLYADCSVAIGKKRCPAMAMQKQEIEAGHAIFFRERVKSLGDAFMTYADDLLNKVVVGIKSSGVIAPKIDKSPVTKDKFQPSMGSYADAINNSLKNGEIPVEVAIPKQPVKEVVAVEGESLMDLAKRMMLAKQ